MVKYSCERCGKQFSQKSHYDSHNIRKTPCENNTDNIKQLVYKAVEEQLKELDNKKLIIKNEVNTNNQMTETETETETEINQLNPNINDVSLVREAGLDKFYTLPSYSKIYINKVVELYDINKWDLIVEPSAGNGSFLNQIPSDNKIGIDISPEHPNIIKQDFFEYYPPAEKKNILVMGNPPFGKISSLAIKFFNHAAKWANVIAFIIPRTFRKISVQNKLDTQFHLIYDEEIPCKPCCFSPPMMVKCCFQIWEKKEEKRNLKILKTKHIDWEFIHFGPIDDKGQPTPPIGADFAMRAYGGKIGEIITENLNILRPKSWHWIKSNIDIKKLINNFNQLNYSNSLNTARQNSMGKGELVNLYTDFFDSKL